MAANWKFNPDGTITDKNGNIINFQSLVTNVIEIDSDTDLVVGGKYVTSTANGSITCSLPDNPKINDTIVIIDADDTFKDNNVTLSCNNSDHKIDKNEDNIALDMFRKYELVYVKENLWRVL